MQKKFHNAMQISPGVPDDYGVQLQKIVSITLQMLQQAEQQEWDALAQALPQRHIELEQLQQLLTLSESTQIQPLLQQLVDLDNKLIDIIREQKQASYLLVKQLTQLKSFYN